MENQLIIPGFQAREKVYPLSITQKANFIYSNIKEKMPKLYDYIMKGESNVYIKNLR